VNLAGGETPFTKGKHILDTDAMGFAMYFFAKGLFCSSMLLLFGEFLKKYLVEKEKRENVSNKASHATSEPAPGAASSAHED
jgi:hypothetical protein